VVVVVVLVGRSIIVSEVRKSGSLVYEP